MEQLPKIVQQRLQATAKAGVHPDPDLLTAFAEKSLNERERAQLLQHLGQCSECRSVVSLAMPEIAAASPIPARSLWLSWPTLRWGALAACAVVVTAAVTLHYERRQDVAPYSERQAAAPAPPANPTPEKLIPDQEHGKLVAKVTSSSALQASGDIASRDIKASRDFKAPGEMAKQQEGTPPASAPAPAVIGGVTGGVTGGRATGGIAGSRLETRPAETNSPRADQIGAGQFADRQLAMVDNLRSADKAKAALTGKPAPAASSATKARPANTVEEAKEEPANERGKNLDYAAGSSNETVIVQAESPPIESEQAAVRRPKDESDKKAQKSAATSLSQAPLVARNVQNPSAPDKATASWTLSPDGALQRSFDSGRTWQTLPVASHVVFRAFAVNDADIWVGGSAGALYHSSDAGRSWVQVKPVADGESLTADIVSVQFADAQHGKVSTESRETWTTGDGGASWHRN